jgi:hypothetical protein
MNGYKEISPYEITENPLRMIGERWMLVTVRHPDGRINTMTASWGGVGVLWGRPVAFIFIRPHTYEFTEAADNITLSFYGEEKRDALRIAGSKSGRDTDKIAECGLTPVTDGEYVSFDEADTVLCVKKLYRDDLHKDCFTDQSPLSSYTAGDFHRMYICEIEKALVRE